MKKTFSKLFIFAFFMALLINPIKSNAATFNGVTETKDSTYIVPFGREIGINYENNETITSNNTDICKVDNSGKLQINGVGKFTLTSKKGDVQNTLNFFAWNVNLREGGYNVYSDEKKANTAGKMEARIFLAISKTNNKETFKIEDHIFIDGKYDGGDLNGKYITSYYDEENDISLSRFYEYALDNKFNDDDDGTIGDQPTTPDKDPEAIKVKLGKTYSPSSSESLTWSAVNEDILRVEDKTTGKVRAIRVGKTELIGKTSSGTKKVELKISVYRDQGQIINVEKIELDKTKIDLKKNETDIIKATVVPNYADNRKVSWVTSNNSVAGVSIRGRVIARAGGTATITASTVNGAKATCIVNISTAKPIFNYPYSASKKEEYKDDSIYVKIEDTGKYYITKVWVREPENQVKKVDAGWGKTVKTVNSMLNNTQNAIVGCNGSGFYVKGSYSPSESAIKSTSWNYTSEGYLVISNGKVLRSISGHNTNCLLGILPNGSLKYYEAEPYSAVYGDNVKDSFTFGPLMIKDGKSYTQKVGRIRQKYSGYAAKRTSVGQVDENNFVIITAHGDSTINAMTSIGLKLKCNLLFNLDGGGSTTLWFRNKTSGEVKQIRKSGRPVADALYFTTLGN